MNHGWEFDLCFRVLPDIVWHGFLLVETDVNDRAFSDNDALGILAWQPMRGRSWWRRNYVGIAGIPLVACMHTSPPSSHKGDWLPGEHIPKPFHMRFHDVHPGNIFP
jgi:hypothetical protein